MFNPICTQSDRLAHCPLDIVYPCWGGSIWPEFAPFDFVSYIMSSRHFVSTFLPHLGSSSVRSFDFHSVRPEIWLEIYVLGIEPLWTEQYLAPKLVENTYVIVARLGKRLAYIFFWSKTMWLNIFHRGPCNYAWAIHFFSQHFKSTNGVFFYINTFVEETQELYCFLNMVTV